MSEQSNEKQMGWQQGSQVAITLAVLNERLEGIEEKLDAIVLTQGRKTDDLEQRIRMVERWMYAVPASIVTAIVAVVVTLTNNT
tara:strand:+ start:2030 stop:2281 length:252 start_codon:yes stop_codon:yes gene_type:complete